MDAREQRGLMIAALTRHIQQKGNLWSVPSQQPKHHPYFVNLKAQTCTCLDHQEGGHKCKHIFAAEYVYQREFEFNADGSVTETQTIATVRQVRKTYKQQWSQYNQAQVNEKAKFQLLLHELCKGIDESPQVGRGRPRIPLRDAIFSVAFKVYSTVSGRRFMSDLADAHAKGYVSRLPSFAAVFHVLENEATADVLHKLIRESANPLKLIETKFAVDSSGFSGSRFDRWYDHKWGGVRSSRAWAKAHIMCGVTTNVITSCEVSHAGDSPTLRPLLADTASRFDVAELSADLAYSSKANLEYVESLGVAPLIPFKKNAVGNSDNRTWNKLFSYFQFKREEFEARYHARSNVESTFSMLKAKFGDSVRSKTDVAMRNEVLCKILCHNIVVLIGAMFELGVDPIFWTEKPLVQEKAAIG